MTSARGANPDLPARLAVGEILLLDAAMGTELDRRGLATRLPLWSALGTIERPDLVRGIHLDNLRAGADVVTTNTFRTTVRMLARAGRDPSEAAALDCRSVQLAREAIAESGRADALVAGSIAPLEDCYTPELTPPDDVALAEHREQARSLAEAGADFLLVETMPTVREAVAALRAARETELPATVGFVCAPGRAGEPPRLLSGETLAEAVAAVEPLEPAAIFANCAAPAVVAEALATLREMTDIPLGGYANLGVVDDERGWEPDATVSGDRYAAVAERWLDLGARIVGGCCGTTPEHTAALRVLLDRRAVNEAASPRRR